jgi:hypothetical protein
MQEDVLIHTYQSAVQGTHMRHPFFNFLIIVAATTALQGCNRISPGEARFFRDCKTVSELAETISERPPQGFQLAFTNSLSALPNSNYEATEKNVREYMHSRGGWKGDLFRQQTYRPVSAEIGKTNPAVDTALLLKQYFGGLEQAGFTSGENGFSKTFTLDSMEAASKSWSNGDHTLIVLGQIIRDRRSGEIVASVHYWGTLNYRPH